MRCRRCGAEVQPTWRVCSVCGANLRRTWRFKIRCRECGQRVRAGLHLCPVCGQPLRKSWRDELYAAALLVLLVLGLYGARQCGGRQLTEAVAARPLAEQLSSETARVSVSPTVVLGGAPEALPTVCPTPLPSPTPAQPLPTVTPTPTETPVPPSATPTPTETHTPSMTPTETPLPPTETPTLTPTISPTPSPSATARLPTRTPTATEVALLPAPKLIGPADGQEFAGPDSQIWLSWEPMGVLAEDEWYAVSLRYYASNVIHYAGTWTKETRWLVPRELYQKPDPAHPSYEWDVTLMRQTGTKPDGGREGVALSQPSEVRKFTWR